MNTTEPGLTTMTKGLRVSADELLGYLTSLHTSLAALVTLAHEKLDALRRADSRALQECALREEELIRRVVLGSRKRDALFARVAQGLQQQSGRKLTLAELTDALPEPQKSTLRARSVALRNAAAELQQKNRVIAKVARNLHSHIRGVFAEVAKLAQESEVYGAKGTQEAGQNACWLDAVG